MLAFVIIRPITLANSQWLSCSIFTQKAILFVKMGTGFFYLYVFSFLCITKSR